MNDATTVGIGRAAPRARNAEATRTAILDAAKTLFARVGYDLTSLRDIAVEAGADPALIKRYFGGKEGLFSAALEASLSAGSLDGVNRATYARDTATMMAGSPHADEAATHTFQFLLRAATSPTTAPMLNAAMQERTLGPIRDWLGGEHASARSRVLLAFFIGLLVERLIRDEPLEGEERDVFIEHAAMALDRELGAEPRLRAAVGDEGAG
jgi:AcrR family transcriptional regulator